VGRLSGWRVLVTRPADAAGALVAALAAAGAEALAVPMVETGPPTDRAALEAALARLSAYDWVVFTSAAGAEHAAASGPGLASFVGGGAGAGRLAAIGPGTAAALGRLGATRVWQPGRAGGAELAAELPLTAGARVLLVRSDLADPATANALRARGARVDDVAAYRTVPRRRPAPELAEQLRDGRIAAVTLASPSAARGLVESCGPAPATYAHTALASIGPTTTRAIEALGLSVAAEADRPGVEGLVEALIELRRRQDGD
jgi:uroporphyrinogen-III synthase